VGAECAACARRVVTIILTTHYINEARGDGRPAIGVINKGELILVENKTESDEEARQEATDAASAAADVR